jgi:hypothetical protein
MVEPMIARHDGNVMAEPNRFNDMTFHDAFSHLIRMTRARARYGGNRNIRHETS